MVNIVGLVGHMVSMTPTKLCRKAVDNMKSEYGCVPDSFHKNRQPLTTGLSTFRLNFWQEHFIGGGAPEWLGR